MPELIIIFLAKMTSAYTRLLYSLNSSICMYVAILLQSSFVLDASFLESVTPCNFTNYKPMFNVFLMLFDNVIDLDELRN